jgi:anti-sigma B factor antagonist
VESKGSTFTLRSDSGQQPPALELLFSVRTDWVRDIVVVTAIGEVDMLTVPRLRAELDKALSQHADAVVLDMSEVTFLSPAGLTELVRAAEAGRQYDEPLRVVVDAQRAVLRPIQLTALDHVLALYETVDQALGRRP